MKKQPYEDRVCVKLDHHCSLRSGYDEVVLCQNKTCEQLEKIYVSFVKSGTAVPGSREQYEYLKNIFHNIEFDAL